LAQGTSLQIETKWDSWLIPIIDWFTSYISNIHQRVTLNNESPSIQNIHAGVQQGSVLGPLLFLININDIHENINSGVRTFADEASMMKSSKNKDELQISVNRDLYKIMGHHLACQLQHLNN
jgi:hypothetical protein